MLEQDYLVRMIMQFVQGIVRSVQIKREQDDPAAAAALLEASIGEATDLDAGVLLGLSPESIASILQVSGTDSSVVEYVSRSLLLASDYLQQAGDGAAACLREAQAHALADAYGIDLGSQDDAESTLMELIALRQR